MKHEICKATGKLCYSKAEAGARIHNVKKNHYKKSFQTNNGKIPIRLYICKECGAFHLTSQPKKNNYYVLRKTRPYKRQKFDLKNLTI